MQGYLREAYHGEPYATRVLVPEAFERADWVEIPARLLRERLPQVLDIARKRERAVYGITEKEEIEKVARSYVDFVELCEAKERQTGEPCLIRAAW